ncbi:MAG: sigma-70 family RNA polymerase sigma factor [Kofleriaceae bacterium]|nr:sigma-70 family RNA polymerase sigma factor [Myxococcales bacterium]MCB9559416.1 sigma-70 family RNA polymerase sigma factor [Kofleriaceae bacterium]
MTSGPSLVRPFVDAAPEALRPGLDAVVDLQRRLWELLAEGRAAWPQLNVDARALAVFVGRQLDADADPDDVLDGLRPTDLYLACACACGDQAAIEAFDKAYMREVDIALARMRVGPPRSNDVKQLVRQRLFVHATPVVVGGVTFVGKIAEYAGRGDLRRWVRSVAVRTCLNEMRKGKHEVLTDDDHLIAQHTVGGDDPELAYMKRTYAGQFKEAFAEALANLGPREQTLLRYHHVDGLNIDEIGAIYRVHRVTAFRWLEKAKEQLVARTLELLRARLKVSPRELDSVLRMIRSQIHLSLVRQLGGPSDKVDDDIEELDASDLEEADGDGVEPR